jgi:hypothetical protein
LKNIQKRLRSVSWAGIVLAGIVLAWTLCATTAAADTIEDLEWWSTTHTNIELPGSDLNGWFFSSDQPALFPTEPDPSQIWSSAGDIATVNHWLSLALELGDDPSLLTELYGRGMISSPDPATAVIQVSWVSQVNGVGQLSSQGPADVPEPMTFGLLAAGLAFLGLYAVLWGGPPGPRRAPSPGSA